MDSSKLTEIICIGIPALIILIIAGIKLFSFLKAKSLIQEGDQALLNGSYDSAQSHYSKALKTRSRTTLSHIRLALLYFKQKEITNAISKFSDAANSNAHLKYKTVEILCSQLNITSDSTLFECFRKGELLSLEHQFENLEKNLDAKTTTAIHLWGESEPPQSSSNGFKEYIPLGSDNSGKRIASPVVSRITNGLVTVKTEFNMTSDGVRFEVTIFHRVDEIHPGPTDYVVTISPGDSQYLTDDAIVLLLNNWKVNEDSTVITENRKEILRLLAIIDTFCSGRELAKDLSVLIHVQRMMPVFWHEAISNRETLTGKEWRYSLHQWRNQVSSETDINFDRNSWHKSAFGLSNEDCKKLADNATVKIICKS